MKPRKLPKKGGKKNAGVGIDFKRIKHKVGKKLKRAQNDTETDFKFKALSVATQSVAQDKSGSATNYHNLTLKELLGQTSHYSEKTRRSALQGLADLFQRHPDELRRHTGDVLSALAERAVDGDAAVRSALRSLLREQVMPHLEARVIRPFMPVLMAHICGAMTHLIGEVRSDALQLLDILMDHVPALIADGYLSPCLNHFCDLLSSAHRGGSLKAASLGAMLKVLNPLNHFLSRAFGAMPLSHAEVNAGHRGQTHGSAQDARSSGDMHEAAGPGPSSTALKQTQGAQRQHGSGSSSSSKTRGSLAGAVPLMSQRCNLPPASMKTMQEQLHEWMASCLHGPATASAGNSVSARAKPVDKAAARAAALSASRSSTHCGFGSGDMVPGGSKAGSLTPAAPTKLAALISSLSDATATAQRMVVLLMGCWLECSPMQISLSPTQEAVAALAAIATAINKLMVHLLQPAAAADPAEGPAGQLMQSLCDIIVKKVASAFPATMPPVRPPLAVHDYIVRYNLQCVQLLGRFLPMAAVATAEAATVYDPSQPWQSTAAVPAFMADGQHAMPAPGSKDASALHAAAAPMLACIPSMVQYYAGVLELAQAVPLPQGQLSEQHSTPPAAGALGEGILPGVAAAVQVLPDPLHAQRLIAAATAFAARQAPRSPARLACIRMQHGLLKAAVAGRMHLEDAAVASWLAPLPKLLWEVAGNAPATTRAALELLLDAARYAAPGSSSMSTLASLQPQLIPSLFTALLPARAAKPGLTKSLQGGTAAATARLSALQATHGSEGVVVMALGAVVKVPQELGALAVDLLYHLGALERATLKPLITLLCTQALDARLASRLIDVLMCRLHAGPLNLPQPANDDDDDVAAAGISSSMDAAALGRAGDDAGTPIVANKALGASVLLSLLFGPMHEDQMLLGVEDGGQLGGGWSRSLLLVNTTLQHLHRFCDASWLLAALEPQLQSLHEAGQLLLSRTRCYSLVRLSALAAPEGRDAVPEALLQLLPRALVSVCVDIAGSALGQHGDTAVVGEACSLEHATSTLCGTLLQMPQLLAPTCQALSAAAAAATGQDGHGQAQGLLAVLRLSVSLVRTQGLRQVLLSCKDTMLAAVAGMKQAVGALPAASAAYGGGVCVAELQRLEQLVADAFGTAFAR